MSAVQYDLIVIGSGPAGQRTAVAAAKMRKCDQSTPKLPVLSST